MSSFSNSTLTAEDEDASLDWDPVADEDLGSFLDIPILSLEGEVATIEEGEDSNGSSCKSSKGDDSSKHMEELVKLKKDVLGILDNICPQNFDFLMERLHGLPITTQTHLQECVELIFEKAVEVPEFSVIASRMCQVLQMKKVSVENSQTETVNFKKLLISLCQKEFNKDYLERPLGLRFADGEMKKRRRWLGNIRFIGELYMRQMLTARIMHECVQKLLETRDEESLECLCLLLTTVGQVLDTETKQKLSKGPQDGLTDLSVYFNVMKKITQDKKVSSRVLLKLMQDVIDLFDR